MVKKIRFKYGILKALNASKLFNYTNESLEQPWENILYRKHMIAQTQCWLILVKKNQIRLSFLIV